MHPVPLDIHASIGHDPEARIDRGDRERARLSVLGIVNSAADDLVAVRCVRPSDVRGRWGGDRGVVDKDGSDPAVVVVVLAGDDSLAEGGGDANDDGEEREKHAKAHVRGVELRRGD